MTVPSARIGVLTVIAPGKWLRVAAVYDEDWLEGQVVDDPEAFIQTVKVSGLPADIFTFTQKLPDVRPRYKYHIEWDNVAAIPITSYAEWRDKQISHDLRSDLKRAEKRGVVVQPVEFTDNFVRAIMEVYNDTPTRQGLPFVHYGKNFDTVKRENSTYLSRSQFIGAYCNDEPIGFIKIVYVGEVACLMQIVSKITHHDKRPTNALIAKAVEVSDQRGCLYLTYGKYTYGSKTVSSLSDFKHRNGFERILYPRYYIPLNHRGRVVMGLGLHQGGKRLIPGIVLHYLLKVRSRMRKGKGVSLVGERGSLEA